MAIKYKEIADILKTQIHNGAFDNNNAFPTEQTIAKTYGISRQTVRQALSILVDEGLVIRRQGSGTRVVHARELPVKPQRKIAVIATYISHYIFPEVLQEIETHLAANDCTTLLFATQNQVDIERRVLKILLSQQIDGIIVEGTKAALYNPNLDLYQQIIQQGIPMVFLHSQYGALSETVAVLDDNVAGSRILVDHLAQKGHTCIAGIFKSDDLQGQQRYAGYISALRDNNLPMESKHVFWYHTELWDSITNESNTFSLMDTLQGCSAVICYNDEVANYLCAYLTKQGLRVPEDLAIVSFDNSQQSEYAAIPITSLSHAPHNTGRIAAEKLVTLLDGNPTQSTAVGWTLIERVSG